MMHISERIIKRKIPQGANRLPMILSFKRALAESSNYQNTSITLDLSKELVDTRIQTFTFQKHTRLNLLRGLPYQKYSKNLIQDPHFQVHIIEEELKLLYGKFKLLKHKLMEVIFNQKSKFILFRTLTKENQQIFNAKLEETLGLLQEICKIILFDYANSTDKLYIKPFPNLQKNKEVHSEESALDTNYFYLSEATEAFNGAFAAYKMLARKNDQESLSFSVLMMLFQYLARARLNLSELSEEIAFTESFNSEKSKILENILSLHSAADVFSIPQTTINDLRINAMTSREDFDTSKVSKEILDNIYNTRLYQNMAKGALVQSKSSFFAKILRTQQSPKVNTKFHSSTEFSLRPPKVKVVDKGWGGPYEYSNISNVYGEGDPDKVRRKNIPRPEHPFFPDLELRRAIKLGSKVSKQYTTP